MEKTPAKSPTTTSLDSESKGTEGGTNVQTPPAFQLKADPIQRKTPGDSTEGEGEGWLDTISNFFSGIGESITNAMGGGQTPVAPSPQTNAPVVAGQQNTTANPTPPPAPATLTRSVGVGGANLPADVRLVQDRLNTLGYLSATDMAAERPPVAQATAVADRSMARTIAAIARYMNAAFGRPGTLIEPNQASATFMAYNPAQGLGTVNVGGNVGRGAQNNAADVRAVQARLGALGYLQPAALTAETPAATVTGRIADANLAQTIAAIHTFNNAVVGSSLYIIRANGREQELLNNPPRFTVANVAITNTVGTGGQNNAADVRAVQARLVQLGYLTAAQQTAEGPLPTATQAVAVGTLTQTIAAINQFLHAMNITANGLITPNQQSHRQLINPSLPEKSSLTLTGGVGAGRQAANNNAAVRAVQDRLHALGILSTSNYMAELVDAATPGTTAATAMPQTLAAIDKFCRTVVGSTDGRIDAGGRAERLLNDPTYGTLTNMNMEANNPDAGYDFQSSNPAINRVIRGLEAIEAGNFTGEIGAVLTNGAGVAASFGKGQVIGGTAIDTLQANQGLRDHYGLTDAMLTSMETRANNTNTRFTAITNLVPRGGTTQVALNAAIATYTTANAQQFITDTGLAADDIARMFHTANMRKHIEGVNVARNGAIVDRSVNVDTQVDLLLADADFSGSTSYLGIDRGSIKTYFRNTDTMGENRAAFKTKAIFNHPDGQRVRNAMTDHNGQAIGRTLIVDTYNQANRAVAQNAQNRARAVAAVTAIMHNRGGTAANWAGQLTTVYGNDYVRRFLVQWDQG